MRAAAPVAAMAVFLAAAPVHAFDARNADIIGLRLGMPESEAAASLRRQGFAVTRDHGSMMARTRDGRVTVDLGEDHTVRQIRYTLTGNGVGETEKIEGSVLDRFGPPDQAKPVAWCRTLSRAGVCPQGGATLSFSAETLTLVLRDWEMPPVP